jgi:hypothetical protein
MLPMDASRDERPETVTDYVVILSVIAPLLVMAAALLSESVAERLRFVVNLL